MITFPFPYSIDGRGLTASRDLPRHVRDLIEQLLFTAPGERANRPDFGSGVRQLLFQPNSRELAAATQFMIQGALQQYLAEYIQPERVEVSSDENVLTIVIQYTLREDGSRQTTTFQLGA